MFFRTLLLSTLFTGSLFAGSGLLSEQVSFSFKSHPSSEKRTGIIRYLVDGNPEYPEERIKKAHVVMSDYCPGQRPRVVGKEFHNKAALHEGSGASLLYIYVHFECVSK